MPDTGTIRGCYRLFVESSKLKRKLYDEMDIGKELVSLKIGQ